MIVGAVLIVKFRSLCYNYMQDSKTPSAGVADGERGRRAVY